MDSERFTSIVFSIVCIVNIIALSIHLYLTYIGSVVIVNKPNFIYYVSLFGYDTIRYMCMAYYAFGIVLMVLFCAMAMYYSDILDIFTKNR